ncbi:ATP-binding protein [Streptomyces sp. NPDC059866]|uniref:ATP-binding protein n=1 Tax=Streptomyces sp. NPDC059866 TaxID=3346978 RepID=UPI00364C6044
MTAATPHGSGVPGYTALLPCEPESVQRARRLVASALSAWDMNALASDAELIVSELLTNTIDHTPCRTARVMIKRLRRHRVRVSVADTSAATPSLSPAGSTGERGRGLMLVDALSSQWGYDRHPHSKTTWAELHLPTADPSSPTAAGHPASTTADHPTSAVGIPTRRTEREEAGR